MLDLLVLVDNKVDSHRVCSSCPLYVQSSHNACKQPFSLSPLAAITHSGAGCGVGFITKDGTVSIAHCDGDELIDLCLSS